MPFRSRSSAFLALICATLLAGGGLPAHAQELAPGATSDQRSTTTAAPTTTTTTTTAPPSTTVAPDAAPTDPVYTPPKFLDPVEAPPATEPGNGQPPPPASAAAPAEEQPAATPPSGPQLGSAEVAAILGSMQRSGASSTAALLDALRTLESLGFDQAEAAKVGFGQFPVAGFANYRDDFYDPRAGPPPHLHQGTDIFAAFDTPARAPVDGVVTFSDGGLGGKGINLAGVDGNVYYLAHMNGFADIRSGAAVRQGDVIGFVGDSGNARGGAPHVHFEIRPGGGAAINPKPILDKWLADAEARVQELVAGFQNENPRILLATGQTRQFDLEEPDVAPQQAEGPLLWASSVNPVGSALRLAEAETARLVPTLDWDRIGAEAQQQATERHVAVDTARSLLSPVNPPLLELLLAESSD